MHQGHSDIKKRFIQFIKNNMGRTSAYDMNALAAQLSYFLIVAFFAMFGTLVSLAGFFSGLMERIEFFFMPVFPDIIGQLVEEILSGVRATNKIMVLILASCTTIWFSSRCFFVVIRSVNTIYRQQRLQTYKVRLFSVVFALGLVGLFVLLFGGLVLGQTFTNYLTEELNLSVMKGWSLIRYAGAALLIFFVVFFVYWFAPNPKVRAREALPGTFFVMAAWMLITTFFSIYVTNFSSFSWILGSIGGIFLFLIWIYWACIIFMIGVRINYHYWLRRRAKKD